MTIEERVNKNTPIVFCEEQLKRMRFEFITRAGNWFLYGLGNERYLFERRRIDNHYQYVLKIETRKGEIIQ